MRVFVYFNLHKKVWSIKALEGSDKGRVIAHEGFVVLANARPRVSEAGRQRVLREKRKNVHAGLVGEWLNPFEGSLITAKHMDDAYEPNRITYNPYKYTTFVYKNNPTEHWQGSNLACMYAEDRGIITFDTEFREEK